MHSQTLFPEEEISCGHDGVSDFGVDFFPIEVPGGRFERDRTLLKLAGEVVETLAGR